MLFTIPAFELNAGQHQIESPFIKPENGYATQLYCESAISKCFSSKMAKPRFKYLSKNSIQMMLIMCNATA